MWRSRPQDPLATTASPAMVRTATFNRGFVTSTGTAQGSVTGPPHGDRCVQRVTGVVLAVSSVLVATAGRCR